WGHFAKRPVELTEPIDRHPEDRKRMTVKAGGRHAVTFVAVVARFAQTDLLRVTLGTGRTHQIRVHLGHVGHPVVGDREYAFGGSRRVTAAERRDAGRPEALAPPPAPPVVAGLVNVRGTLVTVVDGWKALGQPEPAARTEGGGAGTLVLLQIGGEQKTIGFTVDEVVDMLAVNADALEPRQALPGLDP